MLAPRLPYIGLVFALALASVGCAAREAGDPDTEAQGGAQTATYRGTVKFVSDRGFGFIRHDDSAKETFFRQADVRGEAVQAGDEVSFELAPGDKGMHGVEVQKLGTTAGADGG